MAKTKRRHLAALGTKKKQRPLAHLEVKSDPVVKEMGCPRQPNSPAQSSSTSPSCHHQKQPVKDEGEGHRTAEIPHPSMSPHGTEPKSEENEAPVSPSSPYLQTHADDSDTSSWVDVRKQRVIIIIPPPPPPAKPRFLKNRGKLHEGKLKGKVSNAAVYSKSARQDAIGTLKMDNNAERSINRHMRERICRGVPPISSMDILLASALDTDHAICMPSKEKQPQHAATGSQEEASLDTVDSSIQPRRSSLKARKGLKVPTKSNQVTEGRMKRRKISICKSAHLKLMRKHKRPQQATSLANDHSISPDVMDLKAKGSKHGSRDFPVLSSSQAIKILTLRKHLERAGGLRSWLCSVGLGEFKEVFEKRTWTECDLLQLQMDDLKRMGKSAVGPRRKLIWAIHHFSHQFV